MFEAQRAREARPRRPDPSHGVVPGVVAAARAAEGGAGRAEADAARVCDAEAAPPQELT